MHFLIFIALVLRFFTGWFSPPAQLDIVRILSPQKNDALQGNIQITGTVTGIGFQYAEVSFRYQRPDPGEWFLIAQISEPKVDDFLAAWDTSTIVDGDYQIRVQAYYQNGNRLESVVENLRIRNYSPVETLEAAAADSSATAPAASQTPAFTATTEMRPSATAMPPNELIIKTRDLSDYALRGAVSGVLLLVVLGMWLILRSRK